jgi:hypothetical protein
MDENALEILGTLCISIFIASVMNIREPVFTFIMISCIIAYLQFVRGNNMRRYILTSLIIYLACMFVKYTSDYKFNHNTLKENIWKIPFISIILFSIDEINITGKQ